MGSKPARRTSKNSFTERSLVKSGRLPPSPRSSRRRSMACSGKSLWGPALVVGACGSSREPKSGIPLSSLHAVSGRPAADGRRLSDIKHQRDVDGLVPAFDRGDGRAHGRELDDVIVHPLHLVLVAELVIDLP